MRVSQSFSQDLFIRNLKTVRENYEDALARMSTGIRVRFPSDDPQSAAEMLRLTDDIQKLTMRGRGIAQARPWLQMTEQGVSELNTLLIAAKQYAIQGGSDTLQETEMLALAEQIAGLNNQAVGLTNLKVGGRYVFSGTLTDTQPFDTAGAYQGNSTIIEIPLDDMRVAINLPGDEVFGEVGAGGPLDLLNQLETAFRNNDHDSVQALLDPLSTAIAANSALLARVGNLRKVLEDADIRIQDRLTEAEKRYGDLGAADMARAISDSQKFEAAYQSTLAAGSMLFGATFFDYLG